MVPRPTESLVHRCEQIERTLCTFRGTFGRGVLIERSYARIEDADIRPFPTVPCLRQAWVSASSENLSALSPGNRGLTSCTGHVSFLSQLTLRLPCQSPHDLRHVLRLTRSPYLRPSSPGAFVCVCVLGDDPDRASRRIRNDTRSRWSVLRQQRSEARGCAVGAT